MDQWKIYQKIECIRAKEPLIHNITNHVVSNFIANGLLALGARPIMASAVEEVEDIVKVADALVLNIGTLHADQQYAMLLAGKAANKHGVPIVFDPVGVGVSSFRTNSVRVLLQQIDIDFIRGNAAEIANLAGKAKEIKGVDSGELKEDPVEIATLAAKQLRTTIILTGKSDIITDGTSIYKVNNGHPIMTKVTGTGCLLTAIIGAFATIQEDPIQLATAAVSYYGIAAEIAAIETIHKGPGSFKTALINQLANINETQIQQFSAIEKW